MNMTDTASPSTRPRNAASSTTKAKKKTTSLPPETVEYLKAWMMSEEHIHHPYPTEQEKVKIMQDTGIELKQLTNWFVNNRKRYWKPRVEARLQNQTKTVPTMSSKTGATTSATAVPTASPIPIMSKAIAKVISTSSIASLDKSQQVTVTPMGSPARVMAVSEASCSASDAGSVSSADEDVSEQEHTIRIDLHVLKPVTGEDPTEADMTTLSNIPSDRILRTFKDCYITYRIPSNASLYQEQSRRDAELMRLKKQLLTVYYAENGSISSKKRPSCVLFEAVENMAPRPKYRRASVDTWKSACKEARHVHDEALPSLEEATQLFGYASN
mmetsp:Transcript_2970/g.5894  ORF Transcript_2970/g.5894 Transcript_2970/m.5894 type:complete len:328 (-) Transcript_2970:296-1279(-)